MMRVLGVDPGTSVTGWGVVESAPGGHRRIASGVISLSGRLDLAARLRRIHESIRSLILEHEPEALSLEKAFVSRNVQSAFRLGEARGAVLIAAADCGIRIFEYSPAEVKQSVVGYGRADKDQMLRGVALLLSVGELRRADEADALAAAVCHLRVAGWRVALSRAR
ncbi:MAG: crossover junction endodeoxyribonuclease RuvC [Candidatus Binatia bacterium]